jgi:hypothetical protein
VMESCSAGHKILSRPETTLVTVWNEETEQWECIPCLRTRIRVLESALRAVWDNWSLRCELEDQKELEKQVREALKEEP